MSKGIEPGAASAVGNQDASVVPAVPVAEATGRVDEHATAEATGPADEHAALGAWRILRRVGGIREVVLITIIVIAILTLNAINPAILTVSNLIPTLVGMAFDALVAVGMVAALASGGFDLSVGSVMGCSAVVVTYLIGVRNVNPWPASFAAVATGIGWGALNGFLITRVRINPLITTLGTLSMARGVVFIITQGTVLANLPDQFQIVGQSNAFAAVPWVVVIAVVAVIIGDLLMRTSVSLRQIYYIGGNERAARLSGIKVDKIKFLIYVATGTLAAVAGVLTASHFGAANVQIGEGDELKIIAACIIGGASLSGGEGTVIGGFLGLFLLALINDALVVLNVPFYWQQFITGAVLIIAVSIDILVHGRSSRMYRRVRRAWRMPPKETAQDR